MATKSFDELIAGANTIKGNQLPESNTSDLIGDQLVQMSTKLKEENASRMLMTNEYNVSVLRPTGGVKADGTAGGPYYTLETATAILPEIIAQVGGQLVKGAKLLFQNTEATHDVEKYEFLGGDVTSSDFICSVYDELGTHKESAISQNAVSNALSNSNNTQGIMVNYQPKYYNTNGTLRDGGIGWGHTEHYPLSYYKLPISVEAGGNLVNIISYFDADNNYISGKLYAVAGTITDFNDAPINAIYASISNYYNGDITQQQITIKPVSTNVILSKKLNNDLLSSKTNMLLPYQDKGYHQSGTLVDYGTAWKHSPHVPINSLVLPINVSSAGSLGVPTICYFDADDNFCGYEKFTDGDVTITKLQNPRKAKYVSINNSNTIPPYHQYLSICPTDFKSILFNKKIGFLGDSITYNGEYIDSLVNITHCIASRYGVSSSTISKLNVDGWPVPFVERYSDMADDLDGVIVLGGVNDHQLGVPMGSFEDYNTDGSLDNTFYGAMHTLVRGLINKYPQKPIIFFTPMHYQINTETWSASDYTITNDKIVENVRWTPGAGNQSSGGTLLDYVNSIKKVCDFYSIPVIDTHAISTIQPLIPSISSSETHDGIHPNALGGDILANRTCADIERCWFIL
ncbi:SGNH/GDSL hydrolase family protein [Phocaeicola paurosaccharolyticus]|uniref:SGNH/GDSL hydrolase family protein n=1 Tax=Phocaeicola paurosaccharolyticus TaxID=732242 RepID=UPI002FDF8B35